MTTSRRRPMSPARAAEMLLSTLAKARASATVEDLRKAVFFPRQYDWDELEEALTLGFRTIAARDAKRANVPQNKHGTNSAYNNYSCRCWLCKQAHSKYQRDRLAAAKARALKCKVDHFTP